MTNAGLERFNRRYTPGAREMRRIVEQFERAAKLRKGDSAPRPKARRDDRKRPSFVVKFRYDPDDVGVIHVWNPHAQSDLGGRTGRWERFECTDPLAHGIAGGRRPFADRILVRERNVACITAAAFDRADYPWMHFQERMVQRDALEVLNVSAAGTRLLVGLPREGRNPITCSVADVETRAASLVTLTEIAVAIGMSAAAAYRFMQREGHEEVMPGAWARSVLAKIL